jgi:glycosyltransferase involved in cell wall biosynthesis
VKIVLAISETPPLLSGIARTAAKLQDSWTSAGHEVDVLSIEDTGRHSVGEARLTGLLPRWLSLRKRFDRADLVSLHGPVPTFSDALLPLLWLRKRHGTKVVYTHHFDIDFPGLGAMCGGYNWLTHRLARLADHIVVTTPSYASLIGAPEKTTVIPWGADRFAPASLDAKPERFTVLFVGQLRPYKGIDVLIRAAARVPEARVLIVGRGPERARLEALANTEGSANVSFLGPMTDQDIQQLYREAHVIALPSVSKLEAFGITLIEGMAAGCVPIASALPGVSDVVSNAGVTFPVRDVEGLAQTLRLLSDRDEWRPLALHAIERSRFFTWERTFDGYLRLFDSFFESQPQGAAEVAL